MSLERRSELPKGYIWKECQTIGAKFPMPETWFFREESASGTQAFFMTREPIRGEAFTRLVRGLVHKTSDPEGYFKTGVTVNVFFDISRKTRRSANAMARNFMDKPPKEIIPTSQIARQRDGPLVILRRFFRSEAQNVLERPIEAINYYIEFTANGLTDTAYYIMFETPSEKWEEDVEIAKIMIENRVLNKEI